LSKVSLRVHEARGWISKLSWYAHYRRLAVAHRLLSDRRLAHRSITSIAFDAGFADLSYFDRAFRRRYGATPSEVRAASR
jgi:AraC-like DNA-binding protein